ncbi:MAG: sodium-dependent transporter [Oscillospiraceae bacterium]|nr:sodium-dependent transporter [Oscillospiraceae bacterium]
MQENREKFGSRLGFILVSAGCAVGLGNVWKFPYICGMNGGAAFILIYLVCLLLLGFPILICEFSIGRGSKKSVGGALDALSPAGTRWHHFKWFAYIGNYMLMMFYTMVAGWMMYYVVLMCSGRLRGDLDQISGKFTEMLDSPGTMAFWTIVTIVFCIGICSLGLKNGVEKITKVMMIALILLMIVMAVRSVTLDNSIEGIKFYLIPDFGRMAEQGIGNVVFAAMTHAFFTISVGIGSMEIFGSYLSDDRRLTGEAVSVISLDTIIALTAGIIIIPACFAYNVAPDAGPSLLFITLPNVFNYMPAGTVWGTMFFVFMSFAALSTVIAVFENIISISEDIFGWERRKSVGINLAGITVLSMPAVLGFNILSSVQPMGEGSTVMDLEDFIVSYNILPLGSLLMVLFCTGKRGWGFENFVAEADKGEGPSFPAFIRGYMSYVLPLIVLVIYFKGYYDMFESQGTVKLIIWMTVSVVLAAFILWLSFSSASPLVSKTNSAETD